MNGSEPFVPKVSALIFDSDLVVPVPYKLTTDRIEETTAGNGVLSSSKTPQLGRPSVWSAAMGG